MTTTNSISPDLLASLQRDKKSSDSTSTDEVQSRFLTLLTTQLKSQDPMNPVDNAETTSQLAQISTVDGIERLNKSIQQLLGSYQSSEATQAASLVGHYVLVPGSGLQLASGNAYGGVKLDGSADKVTVSIVDSNGIEVASKDLGALSAGSHDFVWDGVTTNGTDAADGRYTIKVTAKNNNGTTVGASALEVGRVDSVVKGTDGVSLQVGNLGMVSLSDIARIM